MESPTIEQLEQIQQIKPKTKTVAFRGFSEQNQYEDKNEQNNMTESQFLKVSYSTRPSKVMTSSWNQKSKSNLTRMSLPSKSQMCIQSSNEINSSITNSKQLKKLSQKDKFACNSCINDTSNDCEICKGKKHLNGSDKIIKFFQYILQFKLGKIQSYNPKKQRLSIKNPSLNQHCNIYFSTINSKFMDDETQEEVLRYSANDASKTGSFLENSQILKDQKETHYGFGCDKCQMDPIVGERYHCKQCGNFDLCNQCFIRSGHYHQMERVQLNTQKKMAQKMNNFLRLSNPGSIRNSINSPKEYMRNTMVAKTSKSSIR